MENLPKNWDKKYTHQSIKQTKDFHELYQSRYTPVEFTFSRFQDIPSKISRHCILPFLRMKPELKQFYWQEKSSAQDSDDCGTCY